MGIAISCCGGSRKSQQEREKGWEATGIVGIRDQGLKEVPLSVEKLKDRATTLDGTHNRIVILPDFLLQFSRIQRLMMAKNSLTELPSQIGVLSTLKMVVVDENQLTTLPDSIVGLSNLEKLSLVSNNITSLPDRLGELKQLKQLHVSGNRLKYFPSSVGDCSKLEILDASNNYLEEVPDSAGNLENLKILQLDSNRLSSLPGTVFVGCIALQTLSMHANPITPEILQATEGWEAFEGRRQTKASKIIAGGAMLGKGVLDEGVDRVSQRK